MIYNDQNFRELLDRTTVRENARLGALPRRTIYGSTIAAEHGLIPYGEAVADLPVEKDWKEIIADCHARQVFPMYHRQAAALEQKPSQNGLNYCWAWALRACLENVRAVEGKTVVSLAPVSLGWLVGWMNSGNYLDGTIKGVRERGICPAEMVGTQYNRAYKTYSAGWKEEALKYRTAEWWDIDTAAGTKGVIAQCLAVLMTGTPLYVALNWWSHALAIFGMTWDESQPNGIVWNYFNSHGDGPLDLAGSRGVPDEAYGVRSSVLL